MKWIEVIEIRTTTASGYKMASDLQRFAETCDLRSEATSITAYSRSSLDGEFCIQLEHESGPFEKNGSRLGISLMDALKLYGMVDHKVWMEISTPH